MPIVGFSFDKISLERKKPVTKDIRVKPSVNVKDIKSNELDLGKKKEEILRFDYEFLVDYQPGIGEITIKGNVLYLDDSKELKSILEGWKKNKKLPPTVVTQVINTILMRCNLKALALSQDVNLPPHIRLPTIKQRVDTKDYIG